MPELLEYKCPNCGGSVEFNSRLQKLKCPYCDSEFEPDALNAIDEELKNETAEDMSWSSEEREFDSDEQKAIKSYICNSCGGEIITDETTMATACPFCDNTVMMTQNMSGILKPDYVIPFKLDKQAAKQGFAKHLCGKRLLPKPFKTETHIDEIKGVYVPFRLFYCDTQASVRYHATRIRKWSDSNYYYTKTSHYSLFRSGGVSFERVPVDGSQKMPDDLMESLEPYNFDDAIDFNAACLAGYFADKYDVSLDICQQRANQRIKTSVEQAFRGTVDMSYASVILENSNVNLKNGKSKYALYPVWLLNTTYKGKKHVFAMNGQTGKFVGNLPVDKKAAALWFTGVSASVAAAFYAIAYIAAMIF